MNNSFMLQAKAYTTVYGVVHVREPKLSKKGIVFRYWDSSILHHILIIRRGKDPNQ